MSKETMEIWKPVKGAEGIYEVSSLGRLKSLTKPMVNSLGSFIRKEKFLNPCNLDNGYKGFNLTINGKKITAKAHRVVCEAFHSNPENKPTVNHKNGIKHDNNSENVEWATHSENKQHAHDTGLAKSSIKSRKVASITGKATIHNAYNANKIVVINTVTGDEYDSIKSAAKAIGLGETALSRRLNGKIENNTNIMYKK